MVANRESLFIRHFIHPRLTRLCAGRLDELLEVKSGETSNFCGKHLVTVPATPAGCPAHTGGVFTYIYIHIIYISILYIFSKHVTSSGSSGHSEDDM